MLENYLVVGVPLDDELIVTLGGSDLRREKARIVLPVMVGTQQYEDLHMVVPDHLPKIGDGLLHRMLRENELTQPAEALNECGIDVIAALVARFCRNVHSIMLDR